jgi:hypothetical protein
LWIVKNGVPWDVALGLDSIERMAFVVIFGGFEGGEFDWSSQQWKKRA